MSRRLLTRASADKLLLNGADDEMHDALALVMLLREAEAERPETDVDADNLTSPQSRHTRLLMLAEVKLRSALVALGSVL